MTSKVFVVVPVHNRIEDTKEFMKSIKKQTYKNFELTIVDDGSTDGTSDYIKKKYPWVNVLHGNGNLFYTGGMRKGISYLKKKAKNGDFLLTLNNDTTFDKDYIKTLVKISQNNGRILVGTICKELDTKKIVDTTHNTNWNPFSLKRSEKKSPDRKLLFDTKTLSGRGTIVPIEVVKKIGNFNKNLPQYGSDSDFFYRAKKNGFTLAVTTEVVTYSLDSAKSQDEIILKKRKKTLADIKRLFFSIRSKYNLWYKGKVIWYNAPTLLKIPTLLKWYAFFLFFVLIVYPLSKINIRIKF